jgi:hypothetical protein
MRGLIELAVVFSFVIGWAVLELVGLRLDKTRAQQKAAEEAAQTRPEDGL